MGAKHFNHFYLKVNFLKLLKTDIVKSPVCLLPIGDNTLLFLFQQDQGGNLPKEKGNPNLDNGNCNRCQCDRSNSLASSLSVGQSTSSSGCCAGPSGYSDLNSHFKRFPV